jgi:hypothetical protein
VNAPPYLASAKNAERLLAQAKRLPAIKQGTDKPANPAETAELASISAASRYKEYALAVKLYTAALADPRLLTPASVHRHNAACAAARLAAGEDPGTPVDAEEAARLRKQARDWLTDDIEGLRDYAYSTQSLLKRKAADRLTEMLYDPDLVSVRDPQRLVGLPEEERKDWEKLWARAEDMRKIADPLLVPPIGQ